MILLICCKLIIFRTQKNIKRLWSWPTLSSIALSGHSHLPLIVAGRSVREYDTATGSNSITFATSLSLASRSARTIVMEVSTERSVARSKCACPRASSTRFSLVSATPCVVNVAINNFRCKSPSSLNSGARSPAKKST